MPTDSHVALVTGSATGIGRSTAWLLAERGFDVAVNYSRSEADAREAVAGVEQRGRRAILCCCDVRNDHAVRGMFDRCATELGGLDVLVNNAATTHFIPHTHLDALTEAIWDEILGVNLKGAFFCSRAAVPLNAGPRGRFDREYRLGRRGARYRQFDGLRGVQRRPDHHDQVVCHRVRPRHSCQCRVSRPSRHPVVGPPSRCAGRFGGRHAVATGLDRRRDRPGRRVPRPRRHHDDGPGRPRLPCRDLPSESRSCAPPEPRGSFFSLLPGRSSVAVPTATCRTAARSRPSAARPTPVPKEHKRTRLLPEAGP